MTTAKQPWWQTTPLSDMSQNQWESLCDGCGKCCRIQLQDDQGQRATTAITCQYMDMNKCQCTVYQTRRKLVPTCVVLDTQNLHSIDWMPDTCAYRLLRDKKPLYSWHHLVSGNKDTVHEQGVSVRGKVLNETAVHEQDYEEYVIQWHTDVIEKQQLNN